MDEQRAASRGERRITVRIPIRRLVLALLTLVAAGCGIAGGLLLKGSTVATFSAECTRLFDAGHRLVALVDVLDVTDVQSTEWDEVIDTYERALVETRPLLNECDIP